MIPPPPSIVSPPLPVESSLPVHINWISLTCFQHCPSLSSVLKGALKAAISHCILMKMPVHSSVSLFLATKSLKSYSNLAYSGAKSFSSLFSSEIVFLYNALNFSRNSSRLPSFGGSGHPYKNMTVRWSRPLADTTYPRIIQVDNGADDKASLIQILVILELNSVRIKLLVCFLSISLKFNLSLESLDLFILQRKLRLRE